MGLLPVDVRGLSPVDAQPARKALAKKALAKKAPGIRATRAAIDGRSAILSCVWGTTRP
jgi:hypothetical protein